MAWRRTNRDTVTNESAASFKPRPWGKSTGRNAVARLAHLWIRRRPAGSNRWVGKRATASAPDTKSLPHGRGTPLPAALGSRGNRRMLHRRRRRRAGARLLLFRGGADLPTARQSGSRAMRPRGPPPPGRGGEKVAVITPATF